MIETTHPDRFATRLLEALSEAAADLAVVVAPGPDDAYLIELHDLAEQADTLPMASGCDAIYSVAVAKLLADLLAPGRQLVRPACPIAPAEPVELPRRFGEAHGDDTPPHGIPRLVVDQCTCEVCGIVRRRHQLGEVAS